MSDSGDHKWYNQRILIKIRKKKKLVKCFAKRMSIYIVVVESIESNVRVQLVGRLD